MAVPGESAILCEIDTDFEIALDSVGLRRTALRNALSARMRPAGFSIVANLPPCWFSLRPRESNHQLRRYVSLLIFIF